MRALDLKAVRDFWHLRAQVLAVSLVIASGVAVLVMALSTLTALEQTTAAYYERYRFADVFASVTRAPNQLARKISQLEGVQTVETRVVKLATLDVPGFAEPATGLFVSIPEDRQPDLNQIVLRSGRWIRPDRPEEILVIEPFAEAHNLRVGDTLTAILNGYRRELHIVGVGLSPEYIYSLGPGALLPDNKRFGVFWMSRPGLSAAFDLDGAFNDVALALSHGARSEPVIQQLDQLLERYGSTGSIDRTDQLSNWFVANELQQITTMSRILPVIFLVIAAFLTHTLLGRLLATERSQIGLFKAFGYSNREVGVHYAKIVVGIALLGLLIGYGFGAWFGRINTEQYATLFRFPVLLYQPSTGAFLIAALASTSAALLGAGLSVYRAVNLSPAEAMSPPAPPAFRRSWLAATTIGQWLDQPTRIVLRNISRWPGRSLMTSIGVAAAVSLMVLSLQWRDALEYLAQTYYFDAQHQNLTLGLSDAKGPSILRDIKHLPGILSVEPALYVGAEFSNAATRHRGSITGVSDNAALQPIFDIHGQTNIAPPREGLVLGTRLAKKLNVTVGDQVWVEILSGRRPTLQLPVTGLIETYIGMPAYLHIDSLNRLMTRGPRVETVNALIDTKEAARLFLELKDIPTVSAVLLRQSSIDSFYDTVVEQMMVMITMFSALAGTMAFGVAYNSTRITLSERGRELATLRVLGFTRAEISYILLSEVALLVVAALPAGCLLGYWLATFIAITFDTELFRVPTLIEPSTYAYSVLVIIAATVLSAAIVNRRIHRLNLIDVLKSRE